MCLAVHRRDTPRRVFRMRAPWVHHVLFVRLPLPPPPLVVSFSLFFSSLLRVYPILSACPSGRAPGESERIPWPPGPRPTNTFSRRDLRERWARDRSVGGECRCAPRSRPVIVATRRRPYGRRNARPGPRAPDRDPERISLSYSTSWSPKWYVFSVPHRACPSVPFPRTSRHRCRRRLLCSRVSERGWIGAVKNEHLTRRDYATPATRWWRRRAGFGQRSDVRGMVAFAS